MRISSLALLTYIQGISGFLQGISSGTTRTTFLQSTTEVENSLFVDATVDHDAVSDYYGKTLQASSDLKTNVCTANAPPPRIQDLIKNIHPEVVSRYYGCGLCIPDDVEGLTMLDLGSGSGRDVYLASQLVGEKGRVIGVDMTDEQLEVAKKHVGYHGEKFGYENVEFYKGYLEKLQDIQELKENSVDVIISNCVINLCMDKEAVLKNCHRLLKQGGELYFSDVYCNRRVPEELRQDAVLWGECLSGALYWNDFVNLAKQCGFADPRLVEDSYITIQNKDVIDKADENGLEFYSATYRLFKIDELEPACEDFGQAVIYKGTIPGKEGYFDLDDHHRMEKGKIFPVCGNSYLMLKNTRFEKHFDFIGNWDTHYGIFKDCGTNMPFKDSKSKAAASSSSSSGGCC